MTTDAKNSDVSDLSRVLNFRQESSESKKSPNYPSPDGEIFDSKFSKSNS